MDIFDPITRSQTLVQQITRQLSKDDAELTALLTALSEHLDEIQLNTHNLSNELARFTQSHNNPSESDSANTVTKPELKSGCYVFSGEKGFFCPHCFDRDGTKAPTTRINSKLRVCPTCRSSLK